MLTNEKWGWIYSPKNIVLKLKDGGSGKAGIYGNRQCGRRNAFQKSRQQGRYCDRRPCILVI